MDQRLLPRQSLAGLPAHAPTSLQSDARVWTSRLAGQARDTSTHDIGFEIMSSFGNGYAITHTKSYRPIIMRAAESLATRYNPTVGAIRSWGAGATTTTSRSSSTT